MTEYIALVWERYGYGFRYWAFTVNSNSKENAKKKFIAQNPNRVKPTRIGSHEIRFPVEVVTKAGYISRWKSNNTDLVTAGWKLQSNTGRSGWALNTKGKYSDKELAAMAMSKVNTGQVAYQR